MGYGDIHVVGEHNGDRNAVVELSREVVVLQELMVVKLEDKRWLVEGKHGDGALVVEVLGNRGGVVVKQ